VDDALGYVYYSDEGVGVRQYYADPARGDEELALFATEGFADDHEGLSLYPTGDSTGYLLVSDQQAARFWLFAREGTPADPYAHELRRVVKVAARESDGSEATARPLGARFPRGLLVAMSDDRTFHYYRWEDIVGASVSP
ncbi:MAG: phytase, partial [Catalinimonas sp.]